MVKNLPANSGGTRNASLAPGSGRFPWRWKQQPTPVSSPGKSHGQRSLAGYSPWRRKEPDTTEHTQTVKENHCKTDMSAQKGSVVASQFSSCKHQGTFILSWKMCLPRCVQEEN